MEHASRTHKKATDGGGLVFIGSFLNLMLEHTVASMTLAARSSGRFWKAFLFSFSTQMLNVSF